MSYTTKSLAISVAVLAIGLVTPLPFASNEALAADTTSVGAVPGLGNGYYGYGYGYGGYGGNPTYPGGGNPTYPGGGYPTYPGGGYPTYPGGGYPGGGYPTYPGGGYPGGGYPGGGYPTYPGGGYPGGGYPTYPGGGYPGGGYPGGGYPTYPGGGYPPYGQGPVYTPADYQACVNVAGGVYGYSNANSIYYYSTDANLAKDGWTCDGFCGGLFAQGATVCGAVALYRFTAPGGAYHYGTNVYDIGITGLGVDATLGYCYPEQMVKGLVPLHLYYNINTNGYYYTTQYLDDPESALGAGWHYSKIECYVSASQPAT